MRVNTTGAGVELADSVLAAIGSVNQMLKVAR